MLKEFSKVRQENGSFRRLFTDDQFDLYVWYGPDRSRITGFQLVYNKKGRRMYAFTWEEDHGFLHSAVDDKGIFNPSPVLVEDGVFPKTAVSRLFSRAAAGLAASEKNIVELVEKKILEFPL